MGAKVKNPRKKFLWSIMFPKHPINTYLFQSCTLPDIEIDQVAHGDVNRDVKTAGRVTIGNLIVEKLMTTAGSDTWLHDWLYSCQDHIVGGGLVPSQYWETAIVNELAEHPMQKPYLNDARTKMASRDFSFRDAYHGNIADYLQAVTPEEFERFIGDQSIDFDRILADNKDVLKRLKQAEDE